ncbi:hypothetical protein Gotur_023945, partial [Gossypium turneri]
KSLKILVLVYGTDVKDEEDIRRILINANVFRVCLFQKAKVKYGGWANKDTGKTLRRSWLWINNKTNSEKLGFHWGHIHDGASMAKSNLDNCVGFRRCSPYNLVELDSSQLSLLWNRLTLNHCFSMANATPFRLLGSTTSNADMDGSIRPVMRRNDEYLLRRVKWGF